ncbi:hypothetical protein Tco_1267734 [Tanacetum coccineum]
MSSSFVSNMLNPSPDTGIDSIFNLNTESTSLIDVLVTTIAEPPFLLKTLETDFYELKQTNQFATVVSSILGIVDAYLANKMNEAVKTVVQLQSNKLRDEAQAENADFINKHDDNIKKIIKDQVKAQFKAQVSKILLKIEKTVNEQLEAELLTRSSNESKTSYVVAANLSELELKKILIHKMERNNRQDDEDKDEEYSARSNRGSNRRRARKEPESTSAPKEKTSKTTGKSTEGSKSHHKSTDELMHTAKDLEEPVHLEFETEVTEDQPDEETSQLPDWFQKPAKPPTPDRDWNKTLPNDHGHLKVDTLTPELLASPTFKLMKGSCKILNKDKKNRLMRVDELHKFIDGTLNDVRTSLDDRLKGIRMKYLSQTIWRQTDRDKAGAMIQAIDK